MKLHLTFKKFDQWMDSIQNHSLFQASVIGIIILSSLLIGLKTYNLESQYLKLLETFDYLITVFFLVEIIIRFYNSHNIKKFLSDGWNIFDTIIVIISLIPVHDSEYALLARLLRVFRILRLVSALPELKMLINTLIKAMPSMGYVALLMFIIFYIYGAIGSIMFETINPNLWSDISISMLTLFRVITFEDWTDVMYETMDVYPLSWIYYVSFIFINAFVVLNMMIGIVIQKMEESNQEMSHEEMVISRLDAIEKKLDSNS